MKTEQSAPSARGTQFGEGWSQTTNIPAHEASHAGEEKSSEEHEHVSGVTRMLQATSTSDQQTTKVGALDGMH